MTLMKNGLHRVKVNGKVPTIKECIEYMASIGWNLVRYKQPKQGTKVYAFHKKGNAGMETLHFTTRELREAFRYGF